MNESNVPTSVPVSAAAPAVAQKSSANAPAPAQKTAGQPSAPAASKGARRQMRKQH